MVTDSVAFQPNCFLFFLSRQLKRFLHNQWDQQSGQFNLVIKTGKNNRLTIFSIRLWSYFSQGDMAINFLWEEIWVGKEMAALANKCCFSNLLMLSDDLSLLESFGLFYQGKCIIPWSCVKIFFKVTFIKPNTTWNWQTLKSSSQSIPNGLHQQGSVKNLLLCHFKRWFYVSHISRCWLHMPPAPEKSLSHLSHW